MTEEHFEEDCAPTKTTINIVESTIGCSISVNDVFVTDIDKL